MSAEERRKTEALRDAAPELRRALECALEILRIHGICRGPALDGMRALLDRARGEDAAP